MRLESYWLFKEILLMSSYILVVFTGYTLLISIFPMLKSENLHSLASINAILSNLLKNYFKGAFCSTAQKFPLIVLRWKSQQSTLWVDFKVESVLQSRGKKIKSFI